MNFPCQHFTLISNSIPNSFSGTMGIIFMDKFRCCIHGRPKNDKNKKKSFLSCSATGKHGVLSTSFSSYFFSLCARGEATTPSQLSQFKRHGFAVIFIRLSSMKTFQKRVKTRFFLRAALNVPVLGAKYRLWLTKWWENCLKFLFFEWIANF